MKTQKWAKVMYYCLLLGWFPYMFVCAAGLWLDPMYRVIIALCGFCLCFIGAMMLSVIFRNNELFKSMEELEEERWKYIEATKRLEKKIREL